MAGKTIIVEHKSILEIRKMLPVQDLIKEEDCCKILSEALEFQHWGVMGKMVILLTIFHRILLTVHQNDNNWIRVECFYHDFEWESDPHIKTFTTSKESLAEIKKRILENRHTEVDFEGIFYGQHGDPLLTGVFE